MTNALFTLERLEGDSASVIWSERINIRPGVGMDVRLLKDEYGANWLFWDKHRLGLFDPDEALHTRATVTFDDYDMPDELQADKEG
jgi:hypothetical protein